MKMINLVKILSICISSMLIAHTYARDTDLFLQSPDADKGTPNVLFVLDNGANWSADDSGVKIYEIMSWGLYQALIESDIDINVGFMGSSKGALGGKIHWAIRSINDTTEFSHNGSEDKTYKEHLRDYFFNDVDNNAAINENCALISTCLGQEYIEKLNNSPYGMYLNEAWLYFAGELPLAGVVDYEAYDSDEDDYDDDFFDPNCTGTSGADPTSASGNYVSPLSSNICGENYIIFVSNGNPSSNDDGPALTALTALEGGPPSEIDLSPDDKQQGSWSDEFARFMAANDVDGDLDNGVQNVTTYAMDVFNVFENCTAVTDDNGTTEDTSDDTTTYENCTGNPTFLGKRALMRSIALNGNGGYYNVGSAEQVVTALNDILDKINARESVFASSTLPVSVNVRGTNLNQVYMGVFQPDGNNKPRWNGNLKLYQLDFNTDPAVTLDANNNPVPFEKLYLVDKDGLVAEDKDNGFINENVSSFWSTVSTYWSFNADTTESDAPDGKEVPKGAAAQQLRDAYASDLSGRKVYTCTGVCAASSTPASPVALTNFDDANTDVTQSDLGAIDATDRTNLINWVRGVDNTDNEDSNGVNTDVRASVHGDVLHSRPAVVNYSTCSTCSTQEESDSDVVIYYGANDGMLHAIQGGTADISTHTYDSTNYPEGGHELWSFVTSEQYGDLIKLRTNPDGSDSSTADKPLFFDGTIGIYQQDNNNDGTLDHTSPENDKVYIYTGMRRGGEFIYALDVSDRYNPKFLWKISSADTGFGELGETWSAPLVYNIGIDSAYYNDGAYNGTADGVATESVPMLVFGGGYDPVADDVRASSYTDAVTREAAYTQGRAIFIVDAKTGKLVWSVTNTTPSSVANAVQITESDMDYSIPSDIAAVNLDNDLFRRIDRLYVGDSGANVWRVNLSDSDPANWSVFKFAQLGGTGANARKFQFAPDVVGTGEGFIAILLGSGDREDPFDGLVTEDIGTSPDITTVNSIDTTYLTTTPIVENRYYMLKDDNIIIDPINETAVVDGTEVKRLIDTTDFLAEGTATAAANSEDGWYIRLQTGEKVVSSSITIAGVVFFGTNTPTSITDESGELISCNSSLGTARNYSVNYLDGTIPSELITQAIDGVKQRFSNVEGGGFPPTPMPIIVEIDGVIREGVISGPTVLQVPATSLNARERVFWHKDID